MLKKIYNLFFREGSFFKSYDFFNTKISLENPQPWLTLSCIRFLDNYLKNNPKSKILEIGGGNSTLYFKKNGYNVKTIESDLRFKDYLKDILEKAKFNIDFIDEIGEELFDIIIIDSFDQRLEYLRQAVHKITKNGFIILDDSERYDLKNLGIKNLKQITFYGLKKESYMENETKILFFNDEFLKI
jgi:hypothetical protein